MPTIHGVRDRRFNFVQILNSMFHDQNISCRAKGFIGFCLTNKENWDFHVSHLCKVLKEGEDAIYSMIKECIENGYAYRYRTRDSKGRLTDVEYIVSDSKTEIEEISKERDSSNEFNKRLPHREMPEVDFSHRTCPQLESPGVEICENSPMKTEGKSASRIYNNTNSNNIKNNCSVLSGEKTPLPSEIPKHETSEKFHPDGHKFTISKEDVYAEVIRSGKKWSGKIIEEAWKIYRDYGGPVRNWFRWIEGTIENLEKKYESYKKKAKICQKKVYQEVKKPTQTEEIMTEKQLKTTSAEHSVWSSENGTKEHPLAKLCLELGLKN